MSESTPSHVLPLRDRWTLWRWFELRSAGFPVTQVLELASPAAAEAADRCLALELRADEARRDALAALRAARAAAPRDARAALDRVVRALRAGSPPPAVTLDAATGDAIARAAAAASELAAARVEADAVLGREAVRLGGVVRTIARDARFREAIAWQNRAVLRRAVDPLLARPATVRDARSRRDEQLVATYLQRYCMKNETIGYFGPSVFGAFTPEGAALSSRPGPEVIRRRVVHLEYWAVDALATRLARLPGIRPWLMPRRMPLVRREDDTLISPFGAEPLPARTLAVFARCDGERTVRAIAAELAADPALGFSGEAEVHAAVDALEQRAAISVGLEIPPHLPPFTTALRRLLERVEDPAVQQAALAPLDRLEAARDALARAAGDADAVDRALNTLETVFTEVTGEQATQYAGETYAGRTVAYEDCSRDVDVACGPELRQELAAPLSLVLASCRWFTRAVGLRYRDVLQAIYDDLRKETGSDRVDYFPFWVRAGGLFHTGATQDNPGTRSVVAEFQARWARLLELPEGARRVQRTSVELAAAAAALFDAPCPGWPTARYHAPDVLIAAEGPEAVGRGDYFFVLGEVHAGLNTLENSGSFAEHPAPDEFLRAIDADLPEGRVSAVPPRRGLRTGTLSMSPNPRNVAWEYTGTRAARPRAQTVAIGDIVITEVDGQLRMCTRDGRRSWDFATFLDFIMREAHLGFLSSRPHTPRVTIDRLVICREAWRFDAADLTFARLEPPAERFLGARRWARDHDLPRFVFVRASSELKPVYVDLASPIYVDLLAKLSRRSTTVTLTELLPGPDQCWLADAHGRRYTSELRMIALDPEPFRPGSRPLADAGP